MSMYIQLLVDLPRRPVVIVLSLELQQHGRSLTHSANGHVTLSTVRQDERGLRAENTLLSLRSAPRTKGGGGGAARATVRNGQWGDGAGLGMRGGLYLWFLGSPGVASQPVWVLTSTRLHR